MDPVSLLPEELWSKIFLLVAESTYEDPRFPAYDLLLSMMLVCRAWHRIILPLLYENVALDWTLHKLRAFLDGHRYTQMVTKCLRFPECEDGDFVTEAATATCTLLAMLPQLEQADLSREDLLLPQALLLQHFSGGTLLRLDILLDVSQKELPEILAVVGQFHQLETLSIMICQQTENPQAERPILPIILPALRTMKYEVTCEGVLPWLHFLGQSRFPELRTLDLVASEYGRDKESQFLSALRPLLEQQPRLQRLQTNLTWSGTRVLLGQPMCIHELAIYIESSIQPDVPLPVITLLPAITTLKLHGIFLSEEVLILRAIVIGLAARAHGQLRCIRMSRYDWAAILAPPDLTLQSRARPDVVPELWASELQRSQCGMQLLWLAQDLRKLGVVLEDRGGKRVDEVLTALAMLAP